MPKGFPQQLKQFVKTGNVSVFDVYTGKKGDLVEKGLGPTVVKSLCNKVHNIHRHIYFDKFFSSVDLSLDLLRVGLYSCGTFRSNCEGFPQQLKQFVKKGLPERGQSITYQCGNLRVSVWQDKQPSTTIATNSNPTSSNTVQRKKRDGTSTAYSCLHSVSKYNWYMGGVDRNYQLHSYYHVRHKSRKHYKYIFWFLFDLPITNTYILSQYLPNTMERNSRTSVQLWHRS